MLSLSADDLAFYCDLSYYDPAISCDLLDGDLAIYDYADLLAYELSICGELLVYEPSFLW